MDLPNLFKHKQNSAQKELFLALLLTDQTVHAALWRVYDGEIIISHRSRLHQFEEDQEQIIQIDQSLQDLGPDSEQTDDVVFGFEPNWVNQQGILEGKKKLLKSVTKDLGLNAVGFVVTTEALYEHLLQKNPVISTVILYLGQRFVDLSLIRQGKLVHQQSVGRSEDVVADLKEAVARLYQQAPQTQKLPANVILTSAVVPGEELHQYHQQLIAQNWSDELQFIQPPVITVFPSDKLIDIVVLEGGKAVAQARGLLQPTGCEPNSARTGLKAASSTDVSQSDKESSRQQFNQQPSSFGVPIKQQVLDESPDLSDPSLESHWQQSKDAGSSVKDKFNPFSRGKSNHSQSRSADSAAAVNKKKSFLGLSQPSLKLIIAGGALAGLLALIGIGYIYLRRTYQAHISFSSAQQTLTEEIAVTLDPEIEQTDPENLVLKVEKTQQTVSQTDSKATTGVKLVGDPAQGTVTVFNKTDQEKSFDKNTVLTGGGRQFTLDETVTVPAATTEENDSGDGETKVYGQEEVTVTAVDIGAEGNLSQETELQVADFSQDTYLAKVKEDFSGGASREIRVVAEQDLTQLEQALTRELLKQAQQELEQSSGEGRYVTATDDYQIAQKEFSAEVGDEVEQIDLDLELQVTGLVYTVDSLKPLAREVLIAQVPKGYRLADQDPDILSNPAELNQETGKYAITLNVSSQAVAEVNQSQLKQTIAGQTKDQAVALLNQDAAIEQFEVEYQPLLANWLLSLVPVEQERIIITSD